MTAHVVHFGERFPNGTDREKFAAALVEAAGSFRATVTEATNQLTAAKVRFDATFAQFANLAISNQCVELSWAKGDALVFARLFDNGYPYAIAWVEYTN